MGLWKKLVGDQHVFFQKKIIQRYQFKNFHISVRETNVNHLFLPILTLLLKTYTQKGFQSKSTPCSRRQVVKLFALFKSQKP